MIGWLFSDQLIIYIVANDRLTIVVASCTNLDVYVT